MSSFPKTDEIISELIAQETESDCEDRGVSCIAYSQQGKKLESAYNSYEPSGRTTQKGEGMNDFDLVQWVAIMAPICL